MKTGPFYNFAYTTLSIVKKKYTANFAAGKPFEGPAVYVVHHNNLKGPVNTILWHPAQFHLWSLGSFYTQKSCFELYYKFTFTERYGMNKVKAAVLAYPSSIAIPQIYKQGNHIPVYRGEKRIIETFKITVDYLKKGEKVLLCPDVDYSSEDEAVGELYEGLAYIEKYYYRDTKKHIPFIPLKLDHENRVIYENLPIYFDDGDFKAQKDDVLKKIKEKL